MSTVKINVGCGEFSAPGWLNIDLGVRGPDTVVWDITEGMPPVVTEPVTHIYMGHVLEHLEHDVIVPTLRAIYHHPLVTNDTRLAVVGPDCDAAEILHRRGELTQADLTTIRYGGGRWHGDRHLWRSTGVETAKMLQDAGWFVMEVSPNNLQLVGWPVVSCIGWQFALLAWKAHDAAPAAT